ncbi:MAG: Flp pilus assembly protein CpaB [Steroidobacter sp.]
MKANLMTIAMGAGALFAAGGAAYLANDYIEGTVAARQAQLASGYEPVKVIVANQDLEPGAFLDASTVSIREIPREFVASAAASADEWSDLKGRVITFPVKSGEPVLRTYLAQEPGAGFSAQLPAGQRALTFQVSDESSIAGLLQPGDRIDLFFTTTNGNESVTIPLLYDITVAATGVRTVTNSTQVPEGQALTYTTITVTVPPGDAAKITLAQEAGKITVTLRQREDDDPTRIERITKQNLLAQNVGKARARPSVEIILGGKGK